MTLKARRLDEHIRDADRIVTVEVGAWFAHDHRHEHDGQLHRHRHDHRRHSKRGDWDHHPTEATP